jgi:hypothetical protein
MKNHRFLTQNIFQNTIRNYSFFQNIMKVDMHHLENAIKENAHFICNSKDHSNGDIISIDASRNDKYLIPLRQNANSINKAAIYN